MLLFLLTVYVSGCGMDKLEWHRVRQILVNVFGDGKITVSVYNISTHNASPAKHNVRNDSSLRHTHTDTQTHNTHTHRHRHTNTHTACVPMTTDLPEASAASASAMHFSFVPSWSYKT